MRGLFMGLDLKAPALGPLGTVFGFFYQPLFYHLPFFFVIRRERYSTYSTWLVSSVEMVAAARSRLPFCVWTLDHTQIIG